MFEKTEKPSKTKTPQKNQTPQVSETPGRNPEPKDTLVSVESLLDQAYIFLRGGDFPKAAKQFDSVLDADPKCAKGYMGKFLAVCRIPSEEDFVPFFVSCFQEKIEEILQTKPPRLRKTVPASTIEIDGGTQAAAASLPDDWKNYWLYFDLAYVPIADAMEEAYKILKRDILDDSNFQKALSFAEGEEKQKYLGYFDRIDEEVEKIKTSKIDEDSVLLRRNYTRYLSEVVPLLRKMRSSKRFSTAEAARFAGTVIYVGSVIIRILTYKYVLKGWKFLEFFANLGGAVFFGAIKCIPLFIICWVVCLLTASEEKKITGELKTIHDALREAASSIENEKSLAFVFPEPFAMKTKLANLSRAFDKHASDSTE
jgi:hypothetical protein